MKRQISLKSSLVASVLILCLCFTALVGTTFAWFTDSATTGSSVIEAGMLDVVLEYWDGDSWENAEGEVLEFQKGGNYHGYVGEVLWEPGCTYELPKIRVRNEGNLAAKVLLKVNGITGDEKLLEAIELETKVSNVPETLKTGSAGAAFTAMEGNSYGLMFGTPDGTVMMDWNLMPKGHTSLNTGHTDTSAEFTISGHMGKDFGNEYQGMTIEGVSITVLATQDIYEYDSFEREYDSDAEFPDFVAVSNSVQLSEALSAGNDAVLTEDISDAPATTVAPYGNYYGIAQNGGVFDGNGNTLDFDVGEMKNGRFDNYGIMTSGGTIKNVMLSGIFRGIVIMNPTETVYIDNVTVGADEDMCYGINTAEGDGTQSVIVTGSTIKGWNSFGTAIKDLSFTNCTFAQGEYYDDVYGRLVKPYVNTVFDSCEFNSGFYIDLSALEDGCTVTLKNCTVNGVELTSENWTQIIVSESDCADGQISIEGKDGTYMSATNILDYVVIE